MTLSPRIAAMTNNKRYGEDAARDHSIRHRMAWLRKDHNASGLTTNPAIERALRERIA
jgi:hypothetical protein